MKKFSFSDLAKNGDGIRMLSTILHPLSEPADGSSNRAPSVKRKLNKKRLLMLIGAVICFFAGLIYSLHLLFYAKPFDETPVFELGSPLTADPSYFLKVGFIADKIIKPDMSGVDISSPGEYNVGIRYFGRDLSTTITIEDTVAPEFLYKDGALYFRTGSEIRPTDLIFAVKDADKAVSVNFDGNLIDVTSLSFDEPGSHSVWIVAKDSSGNTTRTIIDFFTDTPPELLVHDDFYIATGSVADLHDYVQARDEFDGDLTRLVSISPEDVDLSEETEFDVMFSVTDSSDFTTSKTVTVHVMDPEEIQKLIGKGEISRSNAGIIGAINVYDTGLISNQNFEDTLIDLMPSIVHIEVPESAGTYKTGSGYIAEITDDYIYILTNRHVIGQSRECDVYFYTCDCVKAKLVGCAEDYDVAVIKVKLSDLEPGFENFISTVHIDLTYWEKLDDDDNISLGLEKLNPDGTIVHYTYGQLVNLHGNFEFFEPHDQTEISLRLRPGDSGSAVFDARGRLICMAFGYTISPERDWGVPLDEIVSAYEEITGRDLYTY